MLRKGRFILIVLGLMLIAGSAWLAPRALALRHQVRGGQLLVDVLMTFNEGNDAPMACMLTVPADPNAHTQLGQAISYLQTALRYDQTLAQAYLLLGRAYCLTGDTQKAISAYQTFTRLRPENPLGHLELAFAYQKSMADLSGSERSADELRALILTELSTAGVDATQLIPEAGNAFLSQKYQAAASLFEMAASLDLSLSSLDEINWDIATILGKQSLPQRSTPTGLPVYILTNAVRIEAEEMVWLRQGEMLGKPMSNYSPSKIGTFWWNGASAFVVRVTQTGHFRIILLAQNTPPAPVNLRIEHNFAPILNIELTREDMSWQEFETELYLEAGLQLIAVRFTNDARVNGVDRNAVVDWLKLERK